MTKRITVITGHYGSGKTEFALQLALDLAQRGVPTALADLDITNPYFRSRERQQLLESAGIQLYSNSYQMDITAELPAIAASIRAPLENNRIHTIVDAGGDDSGARVLIQFRKYFTEPDCQLLCVINGNRTGTRTLEGALSHIKRIESELSLPITGLISNTHMLQETTSSDIIQGVQLCRNLAEASGIPLQQVLCPQVLLSQVTDLLKSTDGPGQKMPDFFPLHRLIMRENWLDIPIGPLAKEPTHQILFEK